MPDQFSMQLLNGLLFEACNGLLIRKLPPEQLLPTVKQALAAHLLRDRAQI